MVKYLSQMRVRVVLAFAAVYVIWGSTYLAIRFGLESLPPFLMIGARFVIAGALFYAIGRGRDREKLTPVHWRSAVTIGAFLILGGTGLVSWAEQWVPSGLTALLIATVPLWTVLLDWIRPGGTRPGLWTLTGVVVGLIGVVYLISPDSLSGETIDFTGGLVVLLAAGFWAAGSLISRNAPTPRSPVTGLGMNMIAGGVLVMIVALIRGEFSGFSLSEVTTVSWLAFWYQIVFGGIAYASYLWLIRAAGPSRATTYAYVNPAVAMVLGATLGNEVFTMRALIATIIIIGAVALIITRRQKRQTASLEPDTDVPQTASDSSACTAKC